MVGTLVKFWFLAFVSAIPIGPVGLSILRFSLSAGTMFGLFAIFGAMGADFIYASVACFGSALLTDFLRLHQVIIGSLGGVFLVCLGIHFILHPPSFSAKAGVTRIRSRLTPIVSTFLLTLANPASLFAFMGIFSVVAPGQIGMYQRFFMILAIVLGAMSWWLVLLLVLHFARGKISKTIIYWANIGAGCLIILLGSLALGNALYCVLKAFWYGTHCPW